MCHLTPLGIVAGAIGIVTGAIGIVAGAIGIVAGAIGIVRSYWNSLPEIRVSAYPFSYSTARTPTAEAVWGTNTNTR